MKLSIIIVSYNVRYYLEQCLDSVRRAIENIDADVYVVDNHSHDGSVEYLEKRYPTVNFISSNHNLGFARANNIAIRESEGDYVLLLNPDTIVGERTIAQCVAFMDSHPYAGACGVKMLQADGERAKESRRGIPDPLTAFYKMSGLCARYPQSKRFGHYYMSDISWAEPGEIEIVSGAYCMIRRSALMKVGLLDEDFFMYGEDIDLSYRILKGGFKNWYLPYPILHYKGESTHKSSFRYVHVFYDAMLIFFRKHYGHLSAILGLPIKIAIYFKAFAALLGTGYYRAKKALGFFVMKNKQMPEFIFLGSEKSIARCRKIARMKGLGGQFIVGDASNRPDGHLSVLGSLDEQKTYHVVYDTSAYSYEQIFAIFEKNPKKNVVIGTFNPTTGIIITLDEIYSL